MRLLPDRSRFEQDVVGAVGVEWRVEVDQVDGFIAHVVAQDLQVVAVEEGVAAGGCSCHGR